MQRGPWSIRGAGEVGPDVGTAAGHPERHEQLRGGASGPMSSPSTV